MHSSAGFPDLLRVVIAHAEDACIGLDDLPQVSVQELHRRAVPADLMPPPDDPVFHQGLEPIHQRHDIPIRAHGLNHLAAEGGAEVPPLFVQRLHRSDPAIQAPGGVVEGRKHLIDVVVQLRKLSGDLEGGFHLAVFQLVLVALTALGCDLRRAHQLFKLLQAAALVAIDVLCQHRLQSPAVAVPHGGDQIQRDPGQSHNVLGLDVAAVIGLPGDPVAHSRVPGVQKLLQVLKVAHLVGLVRNRQLDVVVSGGADLQQFSPKCLHAGKILRVPGHEKLCRDVKIQRAVIRLLFSASR